MTTDQTLHQRIRNLSQDDVEQLMTGLSRELDELRQSIRKKSRARPDAKLLLGGRGAISHFEILAVAAYRMRGKWDKAQTALDALEAWRLEWNLVTSAALVHAKNDLAALTAPSPEYDRGLRNILELIEIIGMTFRPLTGPQAGWLGVQASAVDKVSN
ncbi:MAG TPA: hypothetical protein VMX97_03555 [Hyphomicrobiaceae bacterium]|nr:hypothetical protein [Hyphomicrobiaceae bacterium]